jgi:hypothetical protein
MKVQLAGFQGRSKPPSLGAMPAVENRSGPISDVAAEVQAT